MVEQEEPLKVCLPWGAFGVEGRGGRAADERCMWGGLRMMEMKLRPHGLSDVEYTPSSEIEHTPPPLPPPPCLLYPSWCFLRYTSWGSIVDLERVGGGVRVRLRVGVVWWMLNLLAPATVQAGGVPDKG